MAAAGFDNLTIADECSAVHSAYKVRRSLAGVPFLDRLAGLALHLAAPDEATVTALLETDLLDAVAPPAAQRLASLRAVRAPPTAAPPGAENAPVEVLAAVVGRPIDED